MLPSRGQTVLYHFDHVNFNGKTERRHRPAIVNEVDDTGLVTMIVMFTRFDRVVPPSCLDPIACDLDWAYRDPHRELVSPHLELIGEPGEVELTTPEPHTWSWWPSNGTWPEAA